MKKTIDPKPDNRKIYNQNWDAWRNMKIYGPASRFLRFLTFDLLRDANKDKIKTILDVGCGEGTNTYFLAKEFPNAKVVGIDFSETGIECAKKIYQSDNLVYRHDVESIHLENKYDLVTCFEVLEHVEKWEPFLDKLCTASNLYLMLSFPTGRMRPNEVNIGHFRNFKTGEVEQYLDSNGIKSIATNYAGFPFYNPIYRDLCQFKNPADNAMVRQAKYSWKQHLLANIIYILFRYFSTKKKIGNKFCGLFIINK